MPYEFTDEPRQPETHASSTRAFAPVHNHAEPKAYDEYEPNAPPPGLMKKRPNIFLWIGIALLLGLFVAMIVLAIGGNEQTSREAWGLNHMGDRTNLDLIGRQEELLKAMVALGKPVVVFLFNGRPLSINYVNQNVPAIFECWYLGQETGRAVADVLFGDCNPSGSVVLLQLTQSLHGRLGSSFRDFVPAVEQKEKRFGAAKLEYCLRV